MISVKNISRIYKKGDINVEALKDVSFDVETGEFVAVVGTSGSGKSTLLHILSGIDKPTSGDVFIDDVKINAMGKNALSKLRRNKFGVVYQFYNLVSVLNVEDNITLPSLLDGKKADKEKLGDILATLGLDKRRRHYPSELSGGQQQRVALARALYNEPSILFADEPTGNLDSANTEEVMKIFEKLNKEFGMTIIMVTHDMDVAKRSGRIITIEDGRLRSDEKC